MPSPRTTDVISELEFLASQFALLSYGRRDKVEISAEELYQRAGQLIFNLENLSIAEFNALRRMEDGLKGALLKAGNITVAAEGQRQKLPEELMRKVNLYAGKGKAVLDLSGKRYVVMATNIPRNAFAPMIAFLKRRSVPEAHIRTLFPRAYGIRNAEQDTQSTLNSFNTIKGALPKEDLMEFYSIWERDIEPHDRAVQHAAVRSLEHVLKEMGGKNGVTALVDQPPFRLEYRHNGEVIPAQWNTISSRSLDGSLEQQLVADIIVFENQNHPLWLLQEFTAQQQTRLHQRRGNQHVHWQDSRQQGVLKRNGNAIINITAPLGYPQERVQQFLALAEQTLSGKPLEQDYTPYHLSVPAGFLPLTRRIRRSNAAERLSETFGGLLAPAAPEMVSEDHTLKKGRYNGIHTVFIFPMEETRRTGIAELQIFTKLGFIDQSDEGRAPHEPYKQKKYEEACGDVRELFPTDLSDAAGKIHLHYTTALSKEVSDVLNSAAEGRVGETPFAERFASMLYSYVEHLTDASASRDLKERIWAKDRQETGLGSGPFPLLLTAPAAYARTTSYWNLAERRQAVEAMKAEVRFAAQMLTEHGTINTTELARFYDDAMFQGQHAALQQLATGLAEELQGETPSREDMLQRFVLATAVSRLREDNQHDMVAQLQENYPGLLHRSQRKPVEALPGFDPEKILLPEGLGHKDYRALYNRLAREQFRPLRELQVKGRHLDKDIVMMMQSASLDALGRLGYTR